MQSENSGLSPLKKAIERVAGNGEATSAMIQSLYNLTQYLKSTYGIEYYGGHKEVTPSRNCPGNDGMEWVARIRQSFKMKTPKQ